MDTKCGGLAVRRPLQPRDNNVAVAPSTVVIGKAPTKPKPRATGRPSAAAAAVERLRARAGCGEALVRVPVPEVSLAEELEMARERRGRMRAAREVARREMDARAAALDREVEVWERRAVEQRRFGAELMRLIGMPEVYTPVESLRSREERKRREAGALGRSGSKDSTSAASPLPGEVGANSCGQESRASVSTSETTKATEISS